MNNQAMPVRNRLPEINGMLSRQRSIPQDVSRMMGTRLPMSFPLWGSIDITNVLNPTRTARNRNNRFHPGCVRK
jgi:hypothetical protein